MNAKTTPKQQKIQQREELLIETAGQILLSEGIAALSMERLAEELKTAKGTIYNHYPNREELLLAMAVRAIDKRQAMFDAASISKGNSRERLVAIGVACEIYFRNYPLHFTVETIVRHASIWERCSDERRDFMRQREQRCVGLVAGVVRSAIAAGDLVLPGNMNPEELTLSLWGLTYGCYVISATSPSLNEIGVGSIYRTVRLGTLNMINGFNWQPVWSADEHDDRIAKICKSVFPDETPLLRNLITGRDSENSGDQHAPSGRVEPVGPTDLLGKGA